MARSTVNLRFLLEYGVLAPPRGSPQPWSLRVSESADSVLELHAEHRCARGLAHDDAAHRELYIGYGAALAHARLALRQLGARDAVEILPDAARPALVARVSFEPSGAPDPESYVLFQALACALDARAEIPERLASRALLEELAGMCSDEGALLRWADADPRGALASAIADADASRALDCGAPSLAEILAVLLPFRRRTFQPATLEWIDEQDFALEAPVLAVLATPTDAPRAWIAAGQALARMLLRARVDGLHASFRDTGADLAAMRARAGNAVPQVLFRLGHPRAAEVVRCEIPTYGAERPSVKRLLAAQKPPLGS